MEDWDFSRQELEQAMDALEQDLPERLKWRVLRAMGVLPAQARAVGMTREDYLNCALHLALDRRQRLAQLCPVCRRRAEESRCGVCGQVTVTGEKNPNFDQSRFEELRENGIGVC